MRGYAFGMSDPQPVVPAPDIIHDGEWVKVKCWACGGSGMLFPPSGVVCGTDPYKACGSCHGRGWIMHLVRIKNDAFDRWCQKEGA